MRQLVTVCLLALTACTPPTNPPVNVVTGLEGTTVYYHPGGDIYEVQVYTQSLPGPVRVVGDCYSGCTSLLNRSDVCTTQTARWFFHGPQIHPRSAQWIIEHYTEIVASWYDTRPKLRNWFMSADDLLPFRMLTGQELNERHGVPLCEGEA